VVGGERCKMHCSGGGRPRSFGSGKAGTVPAQTTEFHDPGTHLPPVQPVLMSQAVVPCLAIFSASMVAYLWRWRWRRRGMWGPVQEGSGTRDTPTTSRPEIPAASRPGDLTPARRMLISATQPRAAVPHGSRCDY
jgi:hypothetical protein